MSLYAIVLLCHSYMRWIIVVFALIVLARSVQGWLAARPWSGRDERPYQILIACVDTQFVLGLALYLGLSPLARAFWGNVALGMKNAPLRFFGVEHVFSMLIALAVLHVGRARSKRVFDVSLRHRRVWTSLLTAFLLILVAIPWPFLPYGRPLWRTGL
jgi:hypothetical protein